MAVYEFQRFWRLGHVTRPGDLTQKWGCPRTCECAGRFFASSEWLGRSCPNLLRKVREPSGENFQRERCPCRCARAEDHCSLARSFIAHKASYWFWELKGAWVNLGTPAPGCSFFARCHFQPPDPDAKQSARYLPPPLFKGHSLVNRCKMSPFGHPAHLPT